MNDLRCVNVQKLIDEICEENREWFNESPVAFGDAMFDKLLGKLKDEVKKMLTLNYKDMDWIPQWKVLVLLQEKEAVA